MGSAFLNALDGLQVIAPEQIQTCFEKINNFITSHLEFDWEVTRRDVETRQIPMLPTKRRRSKWYHIR